GPEHHHSPRRGYASRRVDDRAAPEGPSIQSVGGPARARLVHGNGFLQPGADRHQEPSGGPGQGFRATPAEHAEVDGPLVGMSGVLRQPLHGGRGLARLQGQGERKDRGRRSRVRRWARRTRSSRRGQDPRRHALRRASPGARAPASLLPTREDGRGVGVRSFHYPVTLDLDGRPCLVVGGGAVALRKAIGLLDAGARVTVVSPTLSTGLLELARDGRIRWRPREFVPGDTEASFLVVVATNDRSINRLVMDEARRSRALVNCADDPEHSDFILPALLRRGPL